MSIKWAETCVGLIYRAANSVMVVAKNVKINNIVPSYGVVMKLRRLTTGFLLLVIWMPAALWGQTSALPRGPALCMDRQNLGLSPEQERALADIDRTFQSPLQDLRSRLLAKRLEFQAALSNPETDENLLKTKAAELRSLSRQCQETTTGYQLKIRSVLTPEQRQKLFRCPNPCFPRCFGREP